MVSLVLGFVKRSEGEAREHTIDSDTDLTLAIYDPAAVFSA